ncbi:MAG: putative zinc-binding protein, partial [Thermoanaerobacteraceae bacterium]|nr:putative zinc-binding protein [Thermoanaerobacteraceae bacterium]
MENQETQQVAIFTCAGGSNTGQTANAAGVKLAQAGLGYLACLAGVGAGAENTVKKLAGARRVVVIDGCQIACAKKMLEKARVKIDCYVQVMALGVRKDLR